MEEETHRAALLRLFEIGLAAVRPDTAFPDDLPEPPKGRTIVIGAGKASAAMAKAFTERWPHGPLTGCVVTRYGHALRVPGIDILEAGHPVPDENGIKAAVKILNLAHEAGPDDLVVAMISGGGSALMPAPIEGLSLEEKGAVTRALLASGAPISQINCVRQALSRIKGGKLLAACAPARVFTYLISDIPGDNISLIASGPTFPHEDTRAEALDILNRFAINVPTSALDKLQHTDVSRETMYPPHQWRMIGWAYRALATAAKSSPIPAHILGDAFEGEAKDAAKIMAGLIRSVRDGSGPFEAPCVLLSGGEFTVTHKGAAGRGGPNTEFLLALALELEGAGDIHALACDTDGMDGASDAAGAIIGPSILAKARKQGLDPEAALAAHDSATFFDALGALLITGPTQTNVNDFRAILIP